MNVPTYLVAQDNYTPDIVRSSNLPNTSLDLFRCSYMSPNSHMKILGENKCYAYRLWDTKDGLSGKRIKCKVKVKVFLRIATLGMLQLMFNGKSQLPS